MSRAMNQMRIKKLGVAIKHYSPGKTKGLPPTPKVDFPKVFAIADLPKKPYVEEVDYYDVKSEFHNLKEPLTKGVRLPCWATTVFVPSILATDMGMGQSRCSTTSTQATGISLEYHLQGRIRYKMPRWTKFVSATPGQQKEWNRFLHALFEHERGHADIWVSGFGKKTCKIGDLVATGATREEAGVKFAKLIEAKKESLAREYEALKMPEQEAYDKKHDHGKDQFAVLDINIE